MNIWCYRKIVLNNLKNILFDSICEREIPNNLFKKYIVRIDNIYKYNMNFSYINSYFYGSPIYVIGYHLKYDKWLPIFNKEFSQKKELVNLQFFFKYKEYLKRVQNRTIITLFLINGFDGNIINNIIKYV